MPPKRARGGKARGAAKAKAGAGTSRAAGSARKGRGAGKVAKVKDADIKNAFNLFAMSREELDEDAEVGDDSDDEDEDEGYGDAGVMPVRDLRRCLTALKLPKPPADFFPPSQTHISAQHFLLLAKTLRDSADDSDSASDDRNSDSDGDSQDDQDAEEARAAFALFTNDRSLGAPETRISLADLKRVARELREDVKDEVLQMMIEDANGGDARKGVTMGEFLDVMRKAGMLT